MRSWASSEWILAIVLTFLIRAGFLQWSSSPFQEDPDAYRQLAETWAASGTFGQLNADGSVRPTAFRPPLYPWLLHCIVDRTGALRPMAVGFTHLVCSCLIAGCLISIAGRIGLNRTGRFMVVAAWVFDPISLHQSSLIMTETLATMLATLAWWVWGSLSARRSWRPLLLGLLLGLSVLCRPTAVVWVGVLTVGVMTSHADGLKWARLKNWAIVLAMTSLCLLPWLIRNQRLLGHPIWMTTHGGYTLLLANNPLLYDHLNQNGPDRNWNAEPFHVRWSKRTEGDPQEPRFWYGEGNDIDSVEPRSVESPSKISQSLDEWQDDRLANSVAWQTIVQRPWEFLRNSGYRIGWLWAWWPAVGNGSAAASWLIGTWYALWSLATFFGFWNVCSFSADVRNRLFFTLWPAIALAISLTLVHSVYWSNMRMRAPVLPAFYLVAGLSLYRPRESDGS